MHAYKFSKTEFVAKKPLGALEDIKLNLIFKLAVNFSDIHVLQLLIVGNSL